ncbi:MAG: UDP-N-acetylglucosamine 2-epimerase, partial [Candidatus Krumholzibacteria bacterium]|nr:UDP-N-acetylglucosamine 2-epimerase [Candidatus Krumholzibacteria bacterium]
RKNTERPITVELGTNRLVGTDGGVILEAAKDALGNEMPEHRIPPLWDGKTAGRIADVLEKQFK